MMRNNQRKKVIEEDEAELNLLGRELIVKVKKYESGIYRTSSSFLDNDRAGLRERNKKLSLENAKLLQKIKGLKEKE